MKTLLLKTAFVFILFSGYFSTAFGQYKYLGYEVYDTIGFHEILVPIDSSKSFGLSTGPTNFTNNCKDFGFTIYDDPLVVVHPNTFLVNANNNLTFAKDSACSVFIGFYTNANHTLSQFKIDSTGTILWNVNIPLATNNYIHPDFNSVSASGDWVLVYRDTSYNLCMISIDPTGNILFNGIIMNAPTSSYVDVYDINSLPNKNVKIDSQANLYFTSYKVTDLDTVPFNSIGEIIKTSHKIYKYNKYGNLLWTYSFPFSYPNPGLEASASYELNLLKDTIIISGFRVFSPCYNRSDSVYLSPAIYFIDSSGNLISTYISPDSTLYGDVTTPPYYSIKYLGKGINGNPIFFDLANYYNASFYLPYFHPPTIIEININTLQIGINYDLFQNLYPNLNPEMVDIDNYDITYMEPDPLGNLSFFHFLNCIDSTNNYITYSKYYFMHFDFSGNVVHIDSGDMGNNFYVPTINTSLHTWKKSRNSNDLLRWGWGQSNNYSFYRVLEKWCFDCTPTVTGRVYNDVLNDCQDLNDPAFQSQYLSVDSGASFIFSNSAGNYEAFLDSGPHTIEPVPQYNTFWYSPCITLPLNVNAPASPNVSTGNDIPLALLPNVHEIKTYVSGASPTPGFPNHSSVIIENRGTITESGLVEFWYTDSIFDFTSANPAPDSISAGYLSWNYYNLPINGYAYFNISYQVPASVSLGSPFEFTGIAGDVSIDTFPLNNSQTYQDIVTGSYDPNDKQVFPKGTGPEGYITPQDSMLEYLIRFQNTGTDTAITVRVEDMIDTDLDLATLQIEMASHPYTVQLQGRKLIFTFNNIMLPDSGANLAASNGFVQYTIEQKPGLQIGTEIKNIAAIYFDFNAPIITNMVTNTIDWATSVAHSNATIDSPILKAYPNPFGNSLHLEWNYAEPLLSLTLWNLQGQKVGDFTNLTKGNLSGKVDLGTQSTALPNGIYFLKAETATSLKMLKVVKQ